MDSDNDSVKREWHFIDEADDESFWGRGTTNKSKRLTAPESDLALSQMYRNS